MSNKQSRARVEISWSTFYTYTPLTTLTTLSLLLLVSVTDRSWPGWSGPSWRGRPSRFRTVRSIPSVCPGWSAMRGRPRRASQARSPSWGCCDRWSRPGSHGRCLRPAAPWIIWNERKLFIISLGHLKHLLFNNIIIIKTLKSCGDFSNKFQTNKTMQAPAGFTFLLQTGADCYLGKNSDILKRWPALFDIF